MRSLYLIAFLSILSAGAHAQITDADLAPLLQEPRQYSIQKTSETMTIDGKADEAAWSKAPWSETFVDIAGQAGKEDPYATRYKMLWDNNYLYVYVKLAEPHVWAKLKEQDQSIYQDNALEIFLDPDGDTQNYVEFQINAFTAVWDLLMTKPYRNAGASISSWDIKGLKKAVFVDGTINNPSDKDKSWDVELAFPFSAFRFGGGGRSPVPGTTWRLNFSRVQYETEIKDGDYQRKKDDNGRPGQPTYYVWTSQGLINLHYPERFGFARFSDETTANTNIIDPETEKIRIALWKYYYLQQDFKSRNGKYATTIDDLKKDFPKVTFQDVPGLQLIATPLQFIVQAGNTGKVFTIDHEGKLTEPRPARTPR